jgi:hypothetical protein
MPMLKLCECGCGLPAPIAAMTVSNRGVVKGQPRRFISGHNNGALKHRMAGGSRPKAPEYYTFYAARTRCTNPRHRTFPYYGGRGIQFKFKSFEEFYAHLGPRPEGMSLDRYPNNDGHYEPGNVRWATRKEQRLNQRAPVMSFKLAA